MAVGSVLLLALSACSSGESVTVTGGGAGDEEEGMQVSDDGPAGGDTGDIGDTGNTGDTGGTGGTSGQPGPVNTDGNFALLLTDAVLSKNTERWNNYMRLQLDSALEPLNNIDGLLPSSMSVIYDECGFINAFYNLQDQTITLCDELAEFLLQYWEGDTGLATSTLVFILYHEIGHALTDRLNLLTVGNEESAADSIATVISGATGRAFGSVVAAGFLFNEESSYGDEHTNGEDRSGDIVCWAVGSDQRLLDNPSIAPLIQPFIDANRNCITEFAGQSLSVLTQVPALRGLEESPVTNPDVIALEDPDPPKADTFVGTPTNDLLLQLENTTAGEYWACVDDQGQEPVYAFSGTSGFYASSLESTGLFFDTTQESETSVSLDYRTLTLVETLSDIAFQDGGSLTMVSDTDGALTCQRANI